jgi:hypothetical protein
MAALGRRTWHAPSNPERLSVIAPVRAWSPLMSRPPRRPGNPPAAEEPNVLPAVSGEAQKQELIPTAEAGIGQALQLQAEILRRLHDQQTRITEAVEDRRRSELMIQSTQSLNEAFTGMRRVQEKLMDRLDGPAARSGLGWIHGLIGLLLALAIGGGFYFLRGQLEASTELLANLPREDEAARRAMDSLEARLQSLEAEEKGSLLADLEDLRRRFFELQESAAIAKRERDAAREELGARKADLAKIEGALTAEKARAETAEREQARLSDRALGDQRLIGELNRVVEDLRTRAQAPVAAPTRTIESPPTPPSEPAATPAPEPPALPTPSAPGPNINELIAQINSLLRSHRGSEVYSLSSAESADATGLNKVVFAVHGQDGSLAKLVEADRLTLSLSTRTALLELDFEKGTVAFQQGIARTVKSPFFNNRYQIVVIGVETKAWTDAAFSFLRVK